MPAPLPWFTFRDPDGRAWKVGLSCADDSPALTDAHGWTYFASGTVLLDVEESREHQDAIALHEMMHVAFGLGRDAAEERIITRLAPRLLPILKQFGLRFPRRPRGVAALERRARESEDDLD